MLCFLLKQAFLHDQLEMVDKIIAHLLKTNVERHHDILCSTCLSVEPTRLFINFLMYSYEKKRQPLQLVRFLMNLQDLNTRNTNFQLECLSQSVFILVAHGKVVDAVDLLNNQEQFLVINSARHWLLRAWLSLKLQQDCTVSLRRAHDAELQ